MGELVEMEFKAEAAELFKEMKIIRPQPQPQPQPQLVLILVKLKLPLLFVVIRSPLSKSL